MEMKNVDPKARAEAKAALEAMRAKEQELIELNDSDLELLPEEPKKPEKLTIAVAEAGSQGKVAPAMEYKAFDPGAMRERRIQEGKKMVAEMLKIRDADSLKESLEGKLQSALDQLEDLEENQDTMRAAAQLNADVANAQLQELENILANGDQSQAA